MLKTFIRRSSFFCSFLLLFGGIDWFAYAAEEMHSNLYLHTHREIPKPLPVKATSNLLISLEQYLGRNDLNNLQSKSLDLFSNGRPLILQDANGLVHRSSKISIVWQNLPLESPKTFARQVIGPFPSFETAQRIALLLEAQSKLKGQIIGALIYPVIVLVLALSVLFVPRSE